MWGRHALQLHVSFAAYNNFAYFIAVFAHGYSLFAWFFTFTREYRLMMSLNHDSENERQSFPDIQLKYVSALLRSLRGAFKPCTRTLVDFCGC